MAHWVFVPSLKVRGRVSKRLAVRVSLLSFILPPLFLVVRASVDRRELQMDTSMTVPPFIPSFLPACVPRFVRLRLRRKEGPIGREEGRKEQPGDRRRDRRARGWKKVILVSFVREGDRQDRISIAEKNSIRRENKNEIFACERFKKEKLAQLSPI